MDGGGPERLCPRGGEASSSGGRLRPRGRCQDGLIWRGLFGQPYLSREHSSCTRYPGGLLFTQQKRKLPCGLGCDRDKPLLNIRPRSRPHLEPFQAARLIACRKVFRQSPAPQGAAASRRQRGRTGLAAAASRRRSATGQTSDQPLEALPLREPRTRNPPRSSTAVRSC